jgi:hypothetical protein
LFFTVMWHWYFTFFGSIIIIICSIFPFIRAFVDNIISYFLY